MGIESGEVVEIDGDGYGDTVGSPARPPDRLRRRGAGASLLLNDPRVSRMHGTLEWRGGQYVLSDASSYGTWVYFGNQSEAVGAAAH